MESASTKNVVVAIVAAVTGVATAILAAEFRSVFLQRFQSNREDERDPYEEVLEKIERTSSSTSQAKFLPLNMATQQRLSVGTLQSLNEIEQDDYDCPFCPPTYRHGKKLTQWCDATTMCCPCALPWPIDVHWVNKITCLRAWLPLHKEAMQILRGIHKILTLPWDAEHQEFPSMLLSWKNDISLHLS